MLFECGPHGEAQIIPKGEGGDFPQVRAVVNFVSLSLLVIRLNTKSALTM
jgi:hypothetical protein